MANLPPLPPAGRAPQGGKNATGKPNPKDARAGGGRDGGGKQGGVSSATQSNRKTGDR
ncbi:hypothetical protein J8J14_14130 [Roseomonas sp. SSH11]|uniref:Uncharacterized protein n=1 Tax=Pararoseomonas baculiformis TaxID=2820812 RepID=A0ABS4AFV1_9PROT|nr:hypothetical protein [Pararoseomonas baculiformis]MBP0445911.1 hypothetical protein [Pararoseomonas baculiformis]